MIYGQGVISNFARFVNDGTLVAELGPLEVQAPLGNWNSATGTLTGGTYIANSGALGLDSLGSETITNLVGANVGITANTLGEGILTGNGTVNALGGLANVSHSSIALGQSEFGLEAAIPLTIAPAGGTLNVASSALSINFGADVTVNGNLIQDAASQIGAALLPAGSE